MTGAGSANDGARSRGPGAAVQDQVIDMLLPKINDEGRVGGLSPKPGRHLELSLPRYWLELGLLALW